MIDLPVEFEPDNTLFDRTDLKQEIERLWINHVRKADEPTYGMGRFFCGGPSNFVKLQVNGRILAHHPSEIKFARTDIGHLVGRRPGDKFPTPLLFFVTLYADSPFEGPKDSNTGKAVEVTNAVLGAINTRVLKFLDANVEAVERQRKWFREHPWEKLDGLLPQEAVFKLEEMGW